MSSNIDDFLLKGVMMKEMIFNCSIVKEKFLLMADILDLNF